MWRECDSNNSKQVSLLLRWMLAGAGQGVGGGSGGMLGASLGAGAEWKVSICPVGDEDIKEGRALVVKRRHHSTHWRWWWGTD